MYLYTATLLLLALPILAEVSCPDRCMYSLCSYGEDFTKIKGIQSVILGAPGTTTLPFICDSDGKEVSRVRSGEALIFNGTDYLPISKHRPSGLRPRFAARQIRTGRVNFPRTRGMWGLRRRSSRGNQEKYMDGLCVYVPVKSGAMTTDSSEMISSGKCVQFQTKVPKLIVQLAWDANDDLDLFLREPNGNVINLYRRTSASGAMMTRDLNFGRCGSVGLSWENIMWSKESTPMKGRYRMRVEQNLVCSLKPTKWRLVVTFGGETVLDESGVSTAVTPNTIHRTGFIL